MMDYVVAPLSTTSTRRRDEKTSFTKNPFSRHHGKRSLVCGFSTSLGLLLLDLVGGTVQGPDKVFRVEFLGACDESTARNNPTKLMVWKRRTVRFLDSYVYKLQCSLNDLLLNCPFEVLKELASSLYQ
jgi:hypothetical protein